MFDINDNTFFFNSIKFVFIISTSFSLSIKVLITLYIYYILLNKTDVLFMGMHFYIPTLTVPSYKLIMIIKPHSQ